MRTRSRTRAAAAAAAVLLASAAAGCGERSAASLVQIVDNGTTMAAFEPAVIVVETDTEVRWRNTSARAYAIMTIDGVAGEPAIPADAEAWASEMLQPGDVFAHRFDVPGTYIYGSADEDDVQMIGTVRVVDP